MAKYTKAELHANGEVLTLSDPEDAKRLHAALDVNYFTSADGTLEYGVTEESSQFAVFTIDQTATPLADKPTCDNYGDCPPPRP